MPGLIDVHHHIVPKEYLKNLSDQGVKKAFRGCDFSIGVQIRHLK
jgi:imidazolonepropionase-like amidohydrolase